MTGVYCRLCGARLPLPSLPALPLDEAARRSALLALMGGLAFGHLMEAHADQGRQLVPVLMRVQALIGFSFVDLPMEPGGAGGQAAYAPLVEEERRALAAWLLNPHSITVSPLVAPPAG